MCGLFAWVDWLVFCGWWVMWGMCWGLSTIGILCSHGDSVRPRLSRGDFVGDHVDHRWYAVVSTEWYVVCLACISSDTGRGGGKNVPNSKVCPDAIGSDSSFVTSE